MPPTDSINTKTERVNSYTFKCFGVGITSSDKQPNVEHQTWLPPYQPNEQVEQKIIRTITEGSAIAVSNGSFKEEWGTSAVIIEGDKNARHIITYTFIYQITSKYQDTYRIDLPGIYQLISSRHVLI